MNWSTILPGIQSLLVQLTGLRPGNVGAADDGGQKFTSTVKKGQLSFKVISTRGIGKDESRLEFDEDDEVLRETICGNREFTLQLMFDGYDHKPTRNAEHYLERIYTKLARQTSKDALRALGVAWSDCKPYVNLSASTSDDDRIFSRGARDFSFLTAVNDTEDSDDGIGWIETVELYSDTLNDASGVALAKQISILGPPEAL